MGAEPRIEVGKADIGDVEADVPQAAPRHVPGERHGPAGLRQLAGEIPDLLRPFGQGRVAVHTARFAGDPVGPDIALLEHVDAHAHRSGDQHRRLMVGTAIPEQHDVGDGMRADIGLEIGLPAVALAAVVIRRMGPEQPVAGREVDAPHPVTAFAQGGAEHREERGGDPLQEQERGAVAAYRIGKRLRHTQALNSSS
jgi:hypothetical protein